MIATRSLQVILFIVLFYTWVSVMEWVAHKYIMHKQIIDNSHVNHHIDVRLDQSIHSSFHPEGLIFKPINQLILFFIGWTSAIMLWKVIGMNTWIPWYFLILFVLLISQLYFWMWNSMHSSYHLRYIEINTPMTNENGETSIIYGILPHFRPNKHNWLYKWMKRYHALHHMNKGESKGNYNIILPLTDHLFGTYTPKVDNRKYFSNPKNVPKTEQERWLAAHPVFDIKIVNDDLVLYREEHQIDWKELPRDL